MSQWTHVAAMIRFDGLQGLSKPPDLGNIALYDDDEATWDECDVPKGSEGSLQHDLLINPDQSCMAAYVGTIWGDLRDYEDVQEITDYLNRITKGHSIRQGVAHIAVEYRDVVILKYDDDTKRWIAA